MKKFVLSLILACGALMNAQAMSYEQAREEARFLTDKMAYELNLNDQQYEDCYEINLDYLLSIHTEEDVLYRDYLAYRNADLRHILLDWQWTLFAATDYFLRPVTWLGGGWYFPIYRHYGIGVYFYHHPSVYWSYRGGHGRLHYSGGFYHGRRPHHWMGGFRGYERGRVAPPPRGHHPGEGHPGGHVGHPGSRAGGNPGGRAGGNPGSRAGGNPGGHAGNPGSRAGNPGNHAGNPGSHAGNPDSRSGHAGGRSSNQAGYSIGNGGHPGNGNASTGSAGRSSYGRESSTRTTVHGNTHPGAASQAGRPAGSSVSRGGGSVSRGGSSVSRGGGMYHSGGGARSGGHSGGSHGGGGARGGGRGGR